MITFGSKIRAMRGLLGMNQAELANQTNINRYEISMMERDRYLPTPEAKDAFNAALGIRLDSPEVEAAFRVLAGINQPELPLPTEEA